MHHIMRLGAELTTHVSGSDFSVIDDIKRRAGDGICKRVEPGVRLRYQYA